MIEEKLEQARLQNTKRRGWIAAVSFATVALCVFLVFGLSLFDFPAHKTGSVAFPKKETLSEWDREKVRSEFKNLLQQYENEYEPPLQRANIELWKRDGLFKINELKEEAISNFSSGEYQKAQKNMHLLLVLAREIVDEAEHIFKENMAKARSSLAEDLYDEAKLSIEKALMVNSQAEEALSLQQEIEKLPYLLSLLNEIKISHAENDLQKEYDLLQQLIRVSPTREGVAARLKELKKLINDKKFASYISLGYSDVKNRRAKEARDQYLAAKKIYSERLELSLLLKQVVELEKSLRVESTVKLAEQAVRREDWQQARDYFTRAAKDAPENTKVIEGLKRSTQILGLLISFNQYFNNPYRLGNPNVRSEAEKIVKLAETASEYSVAVRNQAAQLGELITKVNRPLPVTIISDNKTKVKVRSVGTVGVVFEKIIQLKPGNYTFEGMRDGFKSKLVQVFIPYDKGNLSVHIVCDEPI